MKTQQRIYQKRNVVLVLGIVLLIALIAGCADKSQEGPPAEIIEAAKQKTQSIFDELRQTSDTIQDDPELVEEYWDAETERYVLQYYVPIVYGAAVSDSPTAYIIKENGSWKYQFLFDKPYEAVLETK